jgi:hypothetical protein
MNVEQSATEWFGAEPSVMRNWFVQAVKDPKQISDIGKILSPGAEFYMNEWLTKKTGRLIKNVTCKPYDGITVDDGPVVRHQSKFRTNDWHMEVTRRQKGASDTGRDKYASGEFDVMVIFVPGPCFSLSHARIRCIPVKALIDPKKPSHLVARVPAKIRRMYDTDEKTDEVIQSTWCVKSS